MNLETYIKEKYPEKVEEYIRYITPFYYEPGVVYRTLVNGFGEGRPGSKQFMIKNGSYFDNEIHITLVEVNNPADPNHRYGVSLSEAHLKLKRDVEETPKGLLIPNNKSDFIIKHNNKTYRIHQSYWRDYSSKRLGGKIWIHCDEDLPINRHQPYYELYSYFGSKWNLKHVYSYDTTHREQYNIKFGISVRDFKQEVFGNSNIKFIHEPTQVLFDRILDSKKK